MKGVYVCEIVEQVEIGPDVFRTRLMGPEIARESQAGQFVNVRVSKGLDPLLRRPFSVHAVYPQDGLYSLLYVVRGRGTDMLKAMHPGSEVSVVGPLGRPFDLGDSPHSEHVLVAGGCGAAPLCFLSDALCRKWGCEKVTILSGAQRKDALICEAEFRSHGAEVGVSTDDGSCGYHGFVTELLKEHLSRKRFAANVRVYTCGPQAMMREVWRLSRQAGVASCQVSLENNMACGMGVCMGCVQKVMHYGKWRHDRVCTEGPVFEAEDVVWD